MKVSYCGRALVAHAYVQFMTTSIAVQTIGIMMDSMKMDIKRLPFNIYRPGLNYKYRQLRTDLGLFPVLSLTCPLSSSVWLRLELEELGAVSLDDEQSKVLKRGVDLLLLFGIVLMSVLGHVQ